MTSATWRRAPAFRLVPVLIVTVLAACDNVDWGGAEVVVVPPEPHTEEVAAPEETAGDGTLPVGPVLYHVRVAEGDATLAPVAALADDTLAVIDPGRDPNAFGRRFISDRLRRGTEFALFRHGTRVGTVAVQSTVAPEPDACPALPRARGMPELIAGADTVSEFLALAKPYAPDTERAPIAALEPDRGMRVVAPILAERLLRARGASLPGSWQRALAQLQPIPADEAGPRFSATFLVGDTLGPGLDDDGNSIFFITRRDPEGAGYDTAYARFTDYERGGKAAPRVVDFLDWDQDDAVELLLEVYGTSDRWFDALAVRNGAWRMILNGRCERPSPLADGAAAESPDAGPAGTPPGAEANAAALPARNQSARPPGADDPFPEPRIDIGMPSDTPPDTSRAGSR